MKTNPSTELRTGVLYYGDNLDILRHIIPDDSIDLIYFDPPFNSQATYNVLFRRESSAVSHPQTPTWSVEGEQLGDGRSYRSALRAALRARSNVTRLG